MWKAIAREARQTPLIHWNESVFRFMFVRALLSEYPRVRCDVEWRRIDLLVADSEGPSLIEFKFYVRPWLVDLRGKRLRAKGGAGNKNFGEFCDCVEKLAEIDDAKWRKADDVPFTHRYIVLAYADSSDMVGQKSYSHWYDDIQLRDSTRKVASLHRLLTLNEVHCLWPSRTTSVHC